MEVFLFFIGGLTYILIELLWRGHTHWTMFLLGGICFVLIGLMNEYKFRWNQSVLFQSVVGAVIITVFEFTTGCIVNLWLGWQVWDYSELPMNILGQICLPFTMLWMLVSAAAIVLDDYLRYWIFGEEKPKYELF